MLLHALRLELSQTLLAVSQVDALFKEHLVDLRQVDLVAILRELGELINLLNEVPCLVLFLRESDNFLAEGLLLILIEAVNQLLHSSHLKMLQVLDLRLRGRRLDNLLRLWHVR